MKHKAMAGRYRRRSSLVLGVVFSNPRRNARHRPPLDWDCGGPYGRRGVGVILKLDGETVRVVRESGT